MMREIEMMRVKGVYELVNRPVDKNVVGSKWVFAPKFDGEGSLTSRKARIVAQGFTQVQRVDFEETYAATACLESFQLLLAIVASKNLHLWQLDFVAAYLNSNINFDVYMEQPEGFVEGEEREKVWKLHKTLYGTMQGGHDWFKILSKVYQELGYHQSRAEPTVRTRCTRDGKFMIICTYTDDTLGGSSEENEAVKAKQELKERFEVKVMPDIEHMLEIKVEKVTEGIRISQKAYALRTLEKFGIIDCKSKSTPLPVGLSLLTSDSPTNDEEIAEIRKVPY